MAVITTSGLTRRFGSLTAVDTLTLELDAGGVIGLVGPNGSGKSTLIRMLLGLIRPSEGTAQVLGSSIAHPARYAHRVGGLIESPAFVPSLTARASLRSLAQLRGLSDDRVDEVLSAVGLRGRDREPVGKFSLGMKQRLGIAAALLPDPELLVLDEPTNGLDPAGIVEIRQLLSRLGAGGRTVIVSSHLLTEIQAVCDRVVVIRFGQLLFTGPMHELLEQASEHVEVAPERPTDLELLHRLLADAGWPVTAEGDVLKVDAAVGDTPAVNRAAALGGVTLRLLNPRQESLEDVFLRMTGASDGELAAGRAMQALHLPDPTPATQARRSNAQNGAANPSSGER